MGAPRPPGARFLTVFITCDKGREARAIAARLLEARLAACVSVYPKGVSRYWWHGRIEEAREHLLIAKTSERLLPRFIREVKALHGYEVPEIVALPVAGGSADYLGWLAETLQRGKT